MCIRRFVRRLCSAALRSVWSAEGAEVVDVEAAVAARTAALHAALTTAQANVANLEAALANSEANVEHYRLDRDRAMADFQAEERLNLRLEARLAARPIAPAAPIDAHAPRVKVPDTSRFPAQIHASSRTPPVRQRTPRADLRGRGSRARMRGAKPPLDLNVAVNS